MRTWLRFPFVTPSVTPTPDSKPAPTPPVATLQALIRLPDTVTQPGPLCLWPWQREIANAISDLACEGPLLPETAATDAYSSPTQAAIADTKRTHLTFFSRLRCKSMKLM